MSEYGKGIKAVAWSSAFIIGLFLVPKFGGAMPKNGFEAQEEQLADHAYIQRDDGKAVRFRTQPIVTGNYEPSNVCTETAEAINVGGMVVKVTSGELGDANGPWVGISASAVGGKCERWDYDNIVWFSEGETQALQNQS